MATKVLKLKGSSGFFVAMNSNLVHTTQAAAAHIALLYCLRMRINFGFIPSLMDLMAMARLK